jgi:hypothetical protein
MPRLIKGLLFFLFTILLPLGLVAAVQPPPEGGILPEIVLTVPENAWRREYLGLDATREFKIPQIQAQVVIIEIFSMY